MSSDRGIKSRLEIRLLGGLQIKIEDRPLRLTGEKVLGLFAYLALHHAPQTREKLVDLLWPEAKPDRGRSLLSNTLYRLRRVLGDEWLAVETDRIGLDHDRAVWVDVFAFEELTARADSESLAEAVKLYEGELLPELYENWIVRRRVALQEQLNGARLELGKRALLKRDRQTGFEQFYRLTIMDPLNEEAYRGLMRVYLQMGRHAAALQSYQRLARLLADELDLEPQPETRELADTIRSEHALSAQTPTPSPPFVGRRQPRTQLIQRLELAQTGRGGLVLVEGEAGIGKTRLLEEIATSAEWRGFRTVWGRAQPFEAATPYQPLDEALQSMIRKEQSERLRDQLSPAALETLAALVPSLRVGPLMQFVAQPDLAGAVAAGIQSVAKRQPLLIILDDLHRAGTAFWPTLRFVEALKKHPVLILLAYRTPDIRIAEEAWQALKSLERDVSPARISLAGLSPADSGDLAAGLGKALSQEVLAAVHQATRGNPFFLQETISASTITPTEGLTRLFEERLEILSPRTRDALEVASVLREPFSYGLWHNVGGEHVPQAISELVQSRFVEETATGYRFRHELTRQQVYATAARSRLREAHLLAGAELQRAGGPPEVIAPHFERGEAWQPAVKYYRLAGERSFQAYAFDAAVEHFNRAMALLPKLDDPLPEKIELLIHRQRALKITGHLRQWRQDVEELASLATPADHPNGALTALEAQLTVHVLDSDLEEFDKTASRALELAQEIGDLPAEARVLHILGTRRMNLKGKDKAALQALADAAELAEAGGELPLLVSILCDSARTASMLGRHSAAEEKAHRALAITQLRPELYPRRPYALQALAEIAMDQAEWQIAWDTLLQVKELVIELNDRWALAEAEYALGALGAAIGQPELTRENFQQLYDRALADGMAPDSILVCRLEAFLVLAAHLTSEPFAVKELRHKISEWISSMAASRQKIHTLTIAGQILEHMGEHRDALETLDEAMKLFEDFASTGETATLLWHALAAHHCGERQKAQTSLRQAEGNVERHRLTPEQILLQYVRHTIRGEGRDLEAAHSLIKQQAAVFRDKLARQAFVDRVRIHREIDERWSAIGLKTGRRVSVWLAKSSAPLGKALTEDEQVEVQWTLDAGPEDQEILSAEGKAGLRRHRIRRLTQEAAHQGAAATYADLAEALGVSKRTVLRDIRHLAGGGIQVQTRGKN